MSDARERAWETRRKKYGPRGHNSSYTRSGCANCQRMQDLLIRLHVTGDLSEGQVAKATGLHRIEIRRLADEATDRALEHRGISL